MPNVGTLAISVAAKTEKFERGMKRSGTLLGQFMSKVSLAAKAVGIFSGALVAAGGALLTHMVKSQFQAIDALAKTSDKLGITKSQSHRWQTVSTCTAPTTPTPQSPGRLGREWRVRGPRYRP